MENGQGRSALNSFYCVACSYAHCAAGWYIKRGNGNTTSHICAEKFEIFNEANRRPWPMLGLQPYIPMNGI